MATYSIEKLQDKLDKNISCRKKELSLIKSSISLSESNTLCTNIRIGRIMLYAHWEGFIKTAAREYLKYLNNANLLCSEMKENFNTLSLKAIIRDCSASFKTEKYHEITNEIISSSTRVFKVDEKNKLIIDTESNLSYLVLKDILFALGLEYSKYELKSNYINKELVEKRNAIAHGELLGINESNNTDFTKIKEEIDELFNEIISLMDLFKDQILEGAIEKKYLRCS